MPYTVALYTCHDCGCQTTRPDWQEGYAYCDCGHEMEWSHDRPASYVSVAVYEVSRAYGGPEEGGWYYDAGDVVAGTQRCYEECDFPQVELYRELLEKRYVAERPCDNRYHVRIYEERQAPAGYPEKQPYYC